MEIQASSLKPSITRAEEMLYVMHQALGTRVPKELVQLDVDSVAIPRFQKYESKDIDGRPYIMLQAVLHVDSSQVDSANHPWEKLLDVTSMSVPAIYTV